MAEEQPESERAPGGIERLRSIAAGAGAAATARFEQAARGAVTAKDSVQLAAAVSLERMRIGAAAAKDSVLEATERASAAAAAGLERVRIGADTTKDAVLDHGRNATAFIAQGAGAVAAFLSQPELLKWSESVTEATATIYDRALDAEYLRSHIGGGAHRLFDGGHDLLNAWKKAIGASAEDSFASEVAGYVEALWKDVTTVKGLPFATWEKGDYQAWADTFGQIPGVNADWIYDLASYDAFEILAAGLGGVGVLFALTREDLDRLSEMLGAMGINSIIAANPVMGVTVIATAGFTYWRTRGNEKSVMNLGGAAKGATMAVLSSALFAVMGLPILIELSIVLTLTHLTRKHVLESARIREVIAVGLERSREGADMTVARIMRLISPVSEPVLAPVV